MIKNFDDFHLYEDSNGHINANRLLRLIHVMNSNII